MTKKIIGLIFIFLLFVGTAGYMSSQFVAQRNQANILVKEGVVTQGRITNVESSKPMLFIYSYSVSGRVFGGTTTHPGRKCAGKGDIVQVRYLPSNPSISGLDMVKEIENDSQGIFFTSIFLSMVCLIFFGIFVAIRRGNTLGSA